MFLFHIIKVVLLVVVAMLLTACSSNIEDYKSTSPSFDIKEYFTGHVIAHGMIQDYSNRVTRRFCVDLEGVWQGNSGELRETFYFDDGEVTFRNWQLTKLADGRYQGTAEDVEGAAFGQHHGFAFQWQYNLFVPIEDDTYKFFMDDWMYQMDQYRVFNRTTMNKFGATLAEITLFFDKENPERRCEKPNKLKDSTI
ncbi:MAG: DUF3833 domain-containing protein [Gammaproteobacteria bacterium]|nr:DUF3833 domain-containing protein [Gammaproteobacteria bacterium]